MESSGRERGCECHFPLRLRGVQVHLPVETSPEQVFQKHMLMHEVSESSAATARGVVDPYACVERIFCV